MEREPETIGQRESGEDMEDVREEEQRGEQQADGTVDDDEIVDDEEEERSYESGDPEGRDDAGLMD